MSVAAPSIQPMDGIQSTSRSQIDKRALLLLVGFVMVWGFSLSRSVLDPYGPDQAHFQHKTECAMAGDRLYTDIISQDGPGIYAVHWLSTVLFGRSAVAFRIFDACWMGLTLAAMATLAFRESRRWAAGMWAVVLYALLYYSFGHVYTGQRDSFAILPLLLAIHLHTADGHEYEHEYRYFSPYQVAAGALCVAAFSFKSPLGLCFGVLWLQALGEAWMNRRRGWSAWAHVNGLTLGFVCGIALAIFVLWQIGSWPAYWYYFIRDPSKVPPQYVVGHWKLLEMFPRVGVASIVIAVLAAVFWYIDAPKRRKAKAADVSPHLQMVHMILLSVFLAAVGITILYWPRWRGLLVHAAGIAVPAIAVLVYQPWTGRSRIWRTVLLIAAAGLVGMMLQGRFFSYHSYPLLACCAVLVGSEFGRALDSLHSDRRWARIFVIICLAGVMQLGVGKWWLKMSKYSNGLNALAGVSLDEHYERTLADFTPPYRDKVAAARRVQKLTESDEKIAVLMYDPWVYQLADRLPVHYMTFLNPGGYPTHRSSNVLAKELLDTVVADKPKVVLAKVPADQDLSVSRDELEAAVFAQLEDFFEGWTGPIRSCYHLAEVTGRIALLQPNHAN